MARSRRDDLRAGVIAAAIMNAMGGIDGKAVGPGSFFLSLVDDQDQTPEEMADAIEGWALAGEGLIVEPAHPDVAEQQVVRK